MMTLDEFMQATDNPQCRVKGDAYVIVSGDGAFFDGFRDGGACVWITNLQGVGLYYKLQFAERDLVMVRSDKRWTGDPDASIYSVWITDNGYARLGGRV